MYWIFKTFLLALFLTGIGCSSELNTPSNGQVVGTYMGQYGGGVETFMINPEGSFTQTFKIGTNIVYNSSGKWKLSGRVMHFKLFMSPDGLWGGNFDGNPDSAQGAPGSWERGPIRIEFTDWPYHVAKVKGEGATSKPLR